MLKSRLLWQIWSILGFTLIISTMLFGSLVADQVKRDAVNRVEQTLHKQVQALAPVLSELLDSGVSLSPEALTRMTPGITARITLIDRRGRVLADNQKPASQMNNHSDRPEIIRAFSNTYGVVSRYSDTLKVSMLYVAIRVESAGAAEGVLRVALPITSIDEQLRSLQTRIALSALAAGVVLLAIGYMLAFRLTNPVSQMTEVAREIAVGEYQLRLPENREDELGQLAAVINELAQGAQDRIEELTGHRNRLTAVLASLTEGVVAVDLDQQVQHINQAALQIFGLKYDQVIGRKFGEVQTVREIKRMVETCIDEQTNVVATIKFGSQLLECSCILMPEADAGDFSGAILVIDDATERSRLEEVRSDFVANASHELKTPIAAIRGLIETIIDDPAMPKETFSRFAERIRLQTIRLDRIVQDLLQLSRFDSSEREKHLARIDLAGLLRQVHQAKLFDAGDASVEFTLSLQESSLEVEGEAEALNQLITNLVDNAIKYTDQRDGLVQLRLSRLGSMALIEVQDNGMGISKDESQRIFERFYRVDKARSRDLGGTGLGLAIVKHIAQSHMGSVSVESQLGKGSIFSVKIPLADPLEASA